MEEKLEFHPEPWYDISGKKIRGVSGQYTGMAELPEKISSSKVEDNYILLDSTTGLCDNLKVFTTKFARNMNYVKDFSRDSDEAKAEEIRMLGDFLKELGVDYDGKAPSASVKDTVFSSNVYTASIVVEDKSEVYFKLSEAEEWLRKMDSGYIKENALLCAACAYLGITDPVVCVSQYGEHVGTTITQNITFIIVQKTDDAVQYAFDRECRCITVSLDGWIKDAKYVKVEITDDRDIVYEETEPCITMDDIRQYVKQYEYFKSEYVDVDSDDWKVALSYRRWAGLPEFVPAYTVYLPSLRSPGDYEGFVIFACDNDYVF